MKLKSYFNPTTREAQIRMDADAAPASPFVALGSITHEDGDNASGHQLRSISHVIFQHVQEQLYVQYKIQDMQRVAITAGGTYVPVDSFYVDTGRVAVRPGQSIVLTPKVLPSNASKDGYYLHVDNPAIVSVVENNGVFTLTFNKEGESLVQLGIKNSKLYQIIAVESYNPGSRPSQAGEVVPPVLVSSITVAPATVTLTVAAPTQQLTPTVLPANAANKNVTYTSSAPGVATVSSTGLVSRVANGTANITVAASDGSGKSVVRAVTCTA